MHKIFLIHGMGTHDEQSFKDEILSGFESFLKLAGIDEHQFFQHLDFETIEYNSVFEQYRNRLAADSSALASIVKDANLGGEHWLQTAHEEAVRIGTNIGDDDFLNTHVFDILLYRYTHLGSIVRNKIGERIARHFAHENGSPLQTHIIAHSLGTAVTHDTLSLLFTQGLDAHQLNRSSYKIQSLNLIANVSRVLESQRTVPVHLSCVKPAGDGKGCVRRYTQYVHKLDPFTLVKPFKPDSRWVKPVVWSDRDYLRVQIEDVTNDHGHTHDVRHYLQNPEVGVRLVNSILDQQTQREIHGNYNLKVTDQMREAFGELTLSNKASELKAALDKAKIQKLSGVKGMISAGEELFKFVKSYGGQF